MSGLPLTSGRSPLFDLLDDADRDRKELSSTRYDHNAQSPPLNTPFIREFDEARLKGQMLRVFNYMKGGIWRTLSEITEQCKPGGEASISAQLRSLRRKKNGSHTVERRRRGNPKSGLFEYKLIVRKTNV